MNSTRSCAIRCRSVCASMRPPISGITQISQGRWIGPWWLAAMHARILAIAGFDDAIAMRRQRQARQATKLGLIIDEAGWFPLPCGAAASSGAETTAPTGGGTAGKSSMKVIVSPTSL